MFCLIFTGLFLSLKMPAYVYLLLVSLYCSYVLIRNFTATFRLIRLHIYSKQHFLFENGVSSSSLAISRNFFLRQMNENLIKSRPYPGDTLLQLLFVTTRWRMSPWRSLAVSQIFSGTIDCKHINRMPKYRSPVWGFCSSWVPGLIPKTSVLLEVIFVNAFQHRLTSAARGPLYLNSISTVLRGQGSCPSS